MVSLDTTRALGTRQGLWYAVDTVQGFLDACLLAHFFFLHLICLAALQELLDHGTRGPTGGGLGREMEAGDEESRRIIPLLHRICVARDAASG